MEIDILSFQNFKNQKVSCWSGSSEHHIYLEVNVFVTQNFAVAGDISFALLLFRVGAFPNFCLPAWQHFRAVCQKCSRCDSYLALLFSRSVCYHTCHFTLVPYKGWINWSNKVNVQTTSPQELTKTHLHMADLQNSQ
jgi:hypothetical protein